MYCKNCGSELKENGRFCPMCGALTENMPESQENPETAAEITTPAKECAVPRIHAIISGPLAVISIVLRILCVILAVCILWPSSGNFAAEVTETALEQADVIIAILLLAGSSAELPLDFILNRLRFPGEFTSLGYARKIAMSVYALAFASRLGELTYIIRDRIVNDAAENMPLIIVTGILAVLSLVILVYYAVNKAVYSGEKNPARFAGKRSAKIKEKKPTTFMGTVKTIVFILVLLTVGIVAAVLISDKVDAKNYEPYTKENMYAWLDESWKSHELHTERTYSWQTSDSYDQNVIMNDFYDYLNSMSTNLKYGFEVTECNMAATSESGHITVAADISYSDYKGLTYEELPYFETKEDALLPLDNQLRDGENALWFRVSDDWTLEDVDDVARELALNDVHTAAEWHNWSRLITDAANDGARLVYIEKQYDVDEDYLEVCNQELKEKLYIIKTEIENRGFTEKRDIYRAAAESVINLAKYDDSTRISTLTDNLSDEEKVKRSAHGALVTGETVCSGYAYAYKAICDELGLYCRVISGYNGDGGHSWNMIEDGLYVDCTFCDTSWSNMFMFMDNNQLERYDYYLSANQLIPSEAA